MPHDYSEDQLIRKSTAETRKRLLPKLMGGEMDVILENHPTI